MRCSAVMRVGFELLRAFVQPVQDFLKDIRLRQRPALDRALVRHGEHEHQRRLIKLKRTEASARFGEPLRSDSANPPSCEMPHRTDGST